MKIEQNKILDYNRKGSEVQQREFEFLKDQLQRRGVDVEKILSEFEDLQIAIPSWALGSGGTRFGRFPLGGQPGTLEEKMADIGLIHQFTKMASRISLHIPWDIPEDISHIRSVAKEYGLAFDAMNSNTFQDQKDQELSYRFGSLSHTDKAVRQQAIDHNKQVIDYGEALGSKSLTIWLADGSSHPGQTNLYKALARTGESIAEIYSHMPEDWSLFIEYKPFEPYFYSTVIPDWGTSYLLASDTGERAYTLVDLGHHLPGTNIEQIVGLLIGRSKLGGFHFNDSKYADDDITTGSIQPYQLFLIFMEIVQGLAQNNNNPPIAYMIDASHNIKDPLLDLMESLDALGQAFIKAHIVDYEALDDAQQANDVTRSSMILQDAFQTDVRPLIREYRKRQGGLIDPIGFYRAEKIREKLIKDRGSETVATGL